ncbi:hypothetical protein chiPu_0006200 [Chiloscyllium punctatum]|uniref:Uncharacterized protein n=1 Tax=Chiloscyllium punctatum TaxID=137246 RepID=A0A401SBM7_CHIPU|nr:hypothetical protein [Chiloscyllium punctatum]
MAVAMRGAVQSGKAPARESPSHQDGGAGRPGGVAAAGAATATRARSAPAVVLERTSNDTTGAGESEQLFFAAPFFFLQRQS